MGTKKEYYLFWDNKYQASSNVEIVNRVINPSKSNKVTVDERRTAMLGKTDEMRKQIVYTQIFLIDSFRRGRTEFKAFL